MAKPKPRRIHNPADLLLHISRTPAGLRITSPQLPNFTLVARGPVPIAGALDRAFRELDCDRYAARLGQPSDRALWDVACDTVNSDTAPGALAASGVELRPEDVAVTWTNGTARRASGAAMRPMAVNGQRHDPMSWTDLGSGLWQSPAGHRYRESSWQVQQVIAQRSTVASPAPGPVQETFDGLTG